MSQERYLLVSHNKSGFCRFWWPSEHYNDLFQIEYSEEPDEVFVSSAGTGAVARIDCRTGKALWHHGLIDEDKDPLNLRNYCTVLGISFNPHVQRVLAAVQYHPADPQRRRCGLLELDARTGRPVRSVFETELGPLGASVGVHYRDHSAATTAKRCQHVVWPQANPDVVLVTDVDHHVAGQLNLSTSKWERVFGQYGQRGADLESLNEPRDIAFWGSSAWIADRGNQRLLYVDFAGPRPQVKTLLPFPNPNSVRYTGDSPGAKALSANAAVSTEGCYQPFTAVFSDFDFGGDLSFTSLLAHLPLATNVVTFNPFDPFKLMVNQWNSVMEVDWSDQGRSLAPLRRFSKPLAVSAGPSTHGHVTVESPSPWISDPVMGMGYEAMAVRAQATGPATLMIEVPVWEAMRCGIVRPGYEWAVMESLPLDESKMAVWESRTPPAVYRVRVACRQQPIRLSVQLSGY